MIPSRPHKFCKECLGPLVDNFSCWETLGLLIAWEVDDPKLQAVHFLTVASYNLQHPSMFAEGILDDLLPLYNKFLDNKISVTEIRMIVGRKTNGVTRVLKPEFERVIIPKKWRFTIADVYIPEERKDAAQRVREWAMSIREEYLKS